MPPRTFMNPAPKTESAREAAKNFFCDLCQKGYQRHNEYETHIGSMQHASNRRLKDMKEMSKNPQAAEKARRAERARDKEAGLVKLDMTTAKPASAAGGGFKKGGFKSAFGGVAAAAPAPASVSVDDGAGVGAAKVGGGGGGGFKKAFAGAVEDGGGKKGKTDDAAAVVEKAVVAGGGGGVDVNANADGGEDDDAGSETDSDEDLGYELYDPAHPTGCHDANCGCHTNVVPQVIFPE